MARLFLLIFLLIAGVNFPANAKDMQSAGYIQQGCELLAYHSGDSKIWNTASLETKQKAWMCAGALQATAQIMIIQHDFCPPNPILPNKDSLHMLDEYMKTHPEKLKYGMGPVVFLALKEAWPCPGSNK